MSAIGASLVTRYQAQCRGSPSVGRQAPATPGGGRLTSLGAGQWLCLSSQRRTGRGASRGPKGTTGGVTTRRRQTSGLCGIPHRRAVFRQRADCAPSLGGNGCRVVAAEETLQVTQCRSDSRITVQGRSSGSGHLVQPSLAGSGPRNPMSAPHLRSRTSPVLASICSMVTPPRRSSRADRKRPPPRVCQTIENSCYPPSPAAFVSRHR